MNQQKTIVAIIRIAVGLLAAAAVITQLGNSIGLGRNIVNFFSFFTIESNILGVFILLSLGLATLAGKSDERFAFVRGAVTLFMTMTGIIYVLLLAGHEAELQTTIPWVNFVLHYLMPVAFVIDWLLFPPKQHIRFTRALAWVIFPIAYLVYSLGRGAFTGWYPYPFLNPITNGWPQLIATSVVIALATIVLTWLITLRTPRATIQKAM